ncbi:MAG TPA: arsenate reductase ArsC [Vicinamibacteria bacterium]
MTAAVRRVLFLCTGNSARSIMAEALLNHLGGGRWRAASAGSHPKGTVHPQALALLRGKGLPVDGLRSKSWDEFAGPAAEPVDVVITVCDRAAAEECPYWPGAPVRAHWGVDDPAAAPPVEQPRAFERAYAELESRVRRLVALPVESLDGPALRERLAAIGRG